MNKKRFMFLCVLAELSLIANVVYYCSVPYTLKYFVWVSLPLCALAVILTTVVLLPKKE